MIQDPEAPARTLSFYVNYRSFLVPKSLILNMDDYVAHQGQTYNNSQYVHIYNQLTRKYIQANVSFVESAESNAEYILTNIANKKYDPFEIACIIRHFDQNSQFKHDGEKSLNDMTTFMYHLNNDESNVSMETLNENIVSVDFHSSIAALEKAEAHHNECKETFKRCQIEYNVQQQLFRNMEQYQPQQQQYQQQPQQQQQYVPYQQNTPRRVQRSCDAPPQEVEHQQSKHRKINIRSRNKKFRKWFEESIQEEPQPQQQCVNQQQCNMGHRMYGMTPLTATDVPSFQTADGQYDENY